MAFPDHDDLEDMEKDEDFGLVDRGLCLHNPPSAENGIQSDNMVDFQSLAAPQDKLIIEFLVPRSTLYYVNFAKSVFKVRLKIVRNDKTDLTDADHCCLTNPPFFALFRTVELYLGQKLISPEIGANYYYKNYFDLLLSHTPDYIKTTAQAGMVYMDTAYKHDQLDLDADAPVNGGALKRYSKTKKSNVVEIQSHLGLDVSGMSQYILPGVEMRFKLFPQSNEFAIHSASETEAYRFVIQSCVLSLHVVHPIPKVVKLHRALLQKQEAKYFYTRSCLKTFTIGLGVREFQVSQIFKSRATRLGDFHLNLPMEW